MAETHIFDRVRKLSVGVWLFEPAIIGVIGNNLVTNVLENSRVELSLNSLSPLNTNVSKAFVIGLACKSVRVDRSTLNCTSPERTLQNHSRIGTLGVNEGVFSPSRGKTSSFAGWMGNIEPSDTSVHGSATQERNSDFSCIEKLGVKVSPTKLSLIWTRAYSWTSWIPSSAKAQSSKASGSRPLMQRIYATSISPPLPEQRAWTGRRGITSGISSLGMRMILKELAKW